MFDSLVSLGVNDQAGEPLLFYFESYSAAKAVFLLWPSTIIAVSVWRMQRLQCVCVCVCVLFSPASSQGPEG